jgi:hypothetical protein
MKTLQEKAQAFFVFAFQLRRGIDVREMREALQNLLVVADHPRLKARIEEALGNKREAA